MMIGVFRVGFAVAVLSVFGCVSAPAEEGPSEGRQVQTIVRNTVSPFCPGKTLDSCPSPKAGEWRRDIREWVTEGVPNAEIRERLQARVPGFDLGIPSVKSGWLIPVVAVALSTSWLIVMVRRFRVRSIRRSESLSAHQDHALDARLDEELALLD